MDFSKLAPWNWFKHEESSKNEQISIKNRSNSTHNNTQILSLQKEFNNLFENLKQDLEQSFSFPSVGKELKDKWMKPSLDLFSFNNDYVINLELPGVNPKDIEIEISGDVMIIKGEKRQEEEEKNKNFYRLERTYGSFKRVLSLPSDSDINKINSNYKDGILTINIPRKQIPKNEIKKIQISY